MQRVNFIFCYHCILVSYTRDSNLKYLFLQAYSTNSVEDSFGNNYKKYEMRQLGDVRYASKLAKWMK